MVGFAIAIDWSRGDGPSRAVRKYLEALDASHTGDPTSAVEQYTTPPKNVSLTDPAARWTAAPGGPAFFTYSTNYLIDLQGGIIVDIEATPALRTDEVNSTRTMIERVEQRFRIKPRRLVGGTAYGSAAILGWMVDDKAIEQYVSLWDRSAQTDDTFASGDFQWNGLANECRCPAGHTLRSERRQFRSPRTHITKANTIIYRSSQTDRAACSMKAQCCPNTPTRNIARSAYESARDKARAISLTPAGTDARLR
jgi:hypothetical protein